MQHDMYFLFKTYKIINFIFGTKKLSEYDGFKFTESCRFYKNTFVLLSIVQFFIVTLSMDPIIEEIKKITSTAHLTLMMLTFTMLSAAHTVIILHGIFYGSKLQKSILNSIMKVDTYLSFPKSPNFKFHVVFVHLIYALLKLGHLSFDMCTLDSYVLLPQFLNHFSIIAFEVEILHYIIEINEVAKRFDYLNNLLASSLNLKYTEGVLMKMWEKKVIKYGYISLNNKNSMKIYYELCQIVDNIVSCYGLAVISIFHSNFAMFYFYNQYLFNLL